jgi:hypothetical protein
VRQYVEAYAVASAPDDNFSIALGDLSTALGDLLADLLHLADRLLTSEGHVLGSDEAMHQALFQYRSELAEAWYDDATARGESVAGRWRWCVHSRRFHLDAASLNDTEFRSVCGSFCENDDDRRHLIDPPIDLRCPVCQAISETDEHVGDP